MANWQSLGDVAPMEAYHPLRPMKSLAPPGLIAAGTCLIDPDGLECLEYEN